MLLGFLQGRLQGPGRIAAAAARDPRQRGSERRRTDLAVDALEVGAATGDEHRARLAGREAFEQCSEVGAESRDRRRGLDHDQQRGVLRAGRRRGRAHGLREHPVGILGERHRVRPRGAQFGRRRVDRHRVRLPAIRGHHGQVVRRRRAAVAVVRGDVRQRQQAVFAPGRDRHRERHPHPCRRQLARHRKHQQLQLPRVGLGQQRRIAAGRDDLLVGLAHLARPGERGGPFFAFDPHRQRRSHGPERQPQIEAGLLEHHRRGVHLEQPVDARDPGGRLDVRFELARVPVQRPRTDLPVPAARLRFEPRAAVRAVERVGGVALGQIVQAEALHEPERPAVGEVRRTWVVGPRQRERRAHPHEVQLPGKIQLTQLRGQPFLSVEAAAVEARGELLHAAMHLVALDDSERADRRRCAGAGEQQQHQVGRCAAGFGPATRQPRQQPHHADQRQERRGRECAEADRDQHHDDQDRRQLRSGVQHRHAEHERVQQRRRQQRQPVAGGVGVQREVGEHRQHDGRDPAQRREQRQFAAEHAGRDLRAQAEQGEHAPRQDGEGGGRAAGGCRWALHCRVAASIPPSGSGCRGPGWRARCPLTPRAPERPVP
jgi:hypothetical protein